jgi:hypothetical protein
MFTQVFKTRRAEIKKHRENFIMINSVSCTISSNSARIVYLRRVGSEKYLEYFKGCLLWKGQ